MPAPVTSGQAMPAAVMPACAARASAAGMADRRLALAGAAQVLGRAVVGLQAGEAQAGRRSTTCCASAPAAAGGDAAAALADVDLDEHVDAACRPRAARRRAARCRATESTAIASLTLPASAATRSSLAGSITSLLM